MSPRWASEPGDAGGSHLLSKALSPRRAESALPYRAASHRPESRLRPPAVAIRGGGPLCVDRTRGEEDRGEVGVSLAAREVAMRWYYLNDSREEDPYIAAEVSDPTSVQEYVSPGNGLFTEEQLANEPGGLDSLKSLRGGNNLPLARAEGMNFLLDLKDKEDELPLDDLNAVAREAARSYPDDPICEAVLEAERALESLRGPRNQLAEGQVRGSGEVASRDMRQLEEEDRLEVQRKAREEAASA
jgi:hypothetical protein